MNKKMIRVAAIGIIGIFMVVIGIKYKSDNTNVIKESVAYNETTEAADEGVSKIRVYITGAVKNPDVYTVTSDCRIIDVVVNYAGGFTEDADKDAVNLADFIKDGQKIVIPFIGEEDVVSVYEGKSYDGLQNSLVNINTASREELMTLNGIGAALADEIIEYRKVSPFLTNEDIKNVHGISEKIFQKIKNNITV